MNAVKTNLKRLRTARKMTQDELAEKLHVVRQTVSSWETGKTTPDVETLTAIAEALDADITELIYGAKPVDAFVVSQQKKIKFAITLFLLAGVLGFLGASWGTLLTALGLPDTFSADFNFHSSRHLLHLSGALIFPVSCYILLGMAIIRIIESWKEFPFLRKHWISWMACGGVILVSLYVILVSIIMLPFPYPKVFYSVFLWLYYRKPLFVICGLLIGLNPHLSTQIMTNTNSPINTH